MTFVVQYTEISPYYFPTLKPISLPLVIQIRRLLMEVNTLLEVYRLQVI